MPRLSQVPRAAASESVLAAYDRVFGAGRDPVTDPGSATATKALRLEYDDVAERVVEIPAPDGPGVQDWRDPKWADRERG